MSTSIHGELVSFGTALYGAADDPIDVTIMRDGIANGLLHAADMVAQVRCSTVYPNASVYSGGQTHSDTGGTPVAEQWYLMEGGIIGPFPLTMQDDGTPYPVRVRLRGATSNAAGTVAFRIVLCPFGRWRQYHDDPQDYVWQVTGITSTSYAWLSGTSRLTLYDNLVAATAEQAAGWVQSVSVPNATSGGTILARRSCMVAVHLIGKTSNATGHPRVRGFHVAETIGT